MRIGLDARKIRDFGIGFYIFHLFSNIVRLDRENDYFLYLKREDILNFDFSSTRWKKKINPAPQYSLREQLFIPRLLKKDQIELFHSPHYVIPVWKICPTIVTIHDLIHLLFPENLPFKGAYLYAWVMLKNAVYKSDRVITVSENSKHDIVEHLRIPEDKIVVIPNGVNKAFHPVEDKEKIDEVKKRYSTGERFLLFVGNLKPHKNIERLLRAIKLIRNRNLRLVIVGGGKITPPLKEIITQGDLLARVSFLPYLDEETLNLLYNASEALVFPSLYEGFGLPPLEAMACGTPVIASLVSSIPEILGNAAWYVEPRNIESIAQGIEKVVSDSKLKEHLKKLGRERASLYTWENTARRTLELYHQLGEMAHCSM